MGPIVMDQAHDYMVLANSELVATAFIAAYAIEKARIVILAVYHGAQHWPEEF